MAVGAELQGLRRRVSPHHRGERSFHDRIRRFPLIPDALRCPIAPPFPSSLAAVDPREFELTMPVHPMHRAEEGDACIPHPRHLPYTPTASRASSGQRSHSCRYR
ncbi:hypothetical protein D1007_61759 [Hordeum vulgare]|nr:hypothetical protein D1007_61759 [Hordeum vulgare]